MSMLFRVLILSMAALVFVAAGITLWLYELDPIIPRGIRVERSELIKKGPTIIEVRRLVFSSRDDPDVEVCSYLKRMPDQSELVHEGRPVTPRKVEMELACAHTDIEEGRQWRDRQWRLPEKMDPGHWEYSSRYRFRNRVRHRDWWLPAIEFSLP
jgi:hypothetical protein